MSTITTRATDAPNLTDTTRHYARRRLLDELADSRRVLAEHTAVVDDFIDDEVDPDTRSQAAASRQRAAEAIDDLTAALARLDAGTYGTCAGCGNAISAARLEALPATRNCISCAAAGRAA
jgi:RNA polymerase-binding transcription factor DksA